MKIILEFEEEDRDRALLAQHASQLASVITEILSLLRNECKYKDLDVPTQNKIRELREFIYERCKDQIPYVIDQI